MEMHRQKVHVEHICDQCGEKFENSKSLLLHNYKHKGVPDCHVCGATFETSGKYARHMQVVHNGPYRCVQQSLVRYTVSLPGTEFTK
jgi:uncharacterized C2H2 Zn-finger protein